MHQIMNLTIREENNAYGLVFISMLIQTVVRTLQLPWI